MLAPVVVVVPLAPVEQTEHVGGPAGLVRWPWSRPGPGHHVLEEDLVQVFRRQGQRDKNNVGESGLSTVFLKTPQNDFKRVSGRRGRRLEEGMGQ